MTVYVDDARYQYGRMVMCHMVADSHEELVAMADAIGLSRRWIQHEGTAKEHFDIGRLKRLRAIELGAKPVSQRELVQILRSSQ